MMHFRYLLIRMMVISWLVVYSSFGHAQLANVTIQLFDGPAITGSIQSINANGKLIGTGLPPDLYLRDVLAIEAKRAIDKQAEFDVTIQTVGGGSLFVRQPQINPDVVRFESASGLTEFPFQNVRAVVWKHSPAIEQQIANPSSADDTVFVQTPDGERSLTGIVERLDAQQLQIEYQNESRKIDIGKINAIVAADLGWSFSEGLLATVQLVDGSSIVGNIQSLSDDQMNLKLAGESLVSFATNKINRISIQSDRLQYLSDLNPIDVQQRTEFTIERTWQRDRSVENNPLSLRVAQTEEVLQFEKGLGTQSFIQLDFDNANDFYRFRATVGIDAETHGRGDCQMTVRGDGIELWSQRVRGSDDPIEIDVDIKGMKRISLSVHPGQDFDLADHADWCNARFVK